MVPLILLALSLSLMYLNLYSHTLSRARTHAHAQTNVRSATLKSSKFWSWHERTWRSVTMSAQDAAACELWLTGMESQTGTKDQATRITTENCFGRKRRRYVTTAIPLSSDEWNDAPYFVQCIHTTLKHCITFFTFLQCYKHNYASLLLMYIHISSCSNNNIALSIFHVRSTCTSTM